MVARFAPKSRRRQIGIGETRPTRTPERTQTPRRPDLLALADVRKNFGGLAAVNGVSFAVGSGEIVALIGPNGAGKSTLFNVVTGVISATSGEISFDGVLISALSPQSIARRGIARTFQHVKLIPDLSAVDNVALGAHLKGRAGIGKAILGLDREEEAHLLAAAAMQLTRVGLVSEMHRPVGELALGQMRLVEIARALCLDPTILLLDEPAAGLRHLEKQALAELLRGLRAEGMSILVVEHDMGFVMGLADRIVVLDFGEKIAEGAPVAIRTHPDVIEAYLGGVA